MIFDQFVRGQVCALRAHPGEEVEIMAPSKWRQGWFNGRAESDYFYTVRVLSTNAIMLMRESGMAKLSNPRRKTTWEHCAWVPPEIKAQWRRRLTAA